MRVLILMRILPLTTAGIMNIKGPDSRIVMNGATLSASCDGSATGVASTNASSWTQALGYVPVRVHLLGVQQTCVGSLPGAPCASAKDPDPAHGQHFFCEWSKANQDDTIVVTGPFAADYAPIFLTEEGRELVGVYTYFDCRLPSMGAAVSIFGEGAHNLTLEVTLYAGRLTTAADGSVVADAAYMAGRSLLAYRGVPGNNVLPGFHAAGAGCGPLFQQCVAAYYSPTFAGHFAPKLDDHQAQMARAILEPALFEDGCAHGNQHLPESLPHNATYTLHAISADLGNAEADNYVILRMRMPVAVMRFEGATRPDFLGPTHWASNWFGKAKLYGCNSGSFNNGLGCSWVELATINSDADGVVKPSCWRMEADVTDTNMYNYFKLTLFDNSMGANQAASYLRPVLRPRPGYPSVPFPVAPLATPCGPEFRDCVASYYTGTFDKSGTYWPEGAIFEE